MSDWTRNASLVFPVALSAALAQRGALGRRFTHHGLVYAEAMLLSQGMTWFGKATLGRARPFAYLSESTRPDHLHYDVTLERAFFSSLDELGQDLKSVVKANSGHADGSTHKIECAIQK